MAACCMRHWLRLLPVTEQPSDEIASAPRDRAGAGSGMLSTSRLLGKTTGSALVALVLGLSHGGPQGVEVGTKLCIGMAAAFAAIAMVLSTLRVRQPQSV